MNRIFRSLWNDARQQYIVTNEKQASRGKRTKSALIAAVALAVASGAAFASSYHEPGRIGNQSSWETAEYQKDWGLTAMHASKAYSLGFNGAHTTVGVMDSGALLQKHPELAGSRFVAVHAEGTYSYTGNHYQKSVEGIGDDFGNGDYTAGDYFSIDGNFIAYTNDSHGTHVTGTVGANRDGSEFHGVAWAPRSPSAIPARRTTTTTARSRTTTSTTRAGPPSPTCSSRTTARSRTARAAAASSTTPSARTSATPPPTAPRLPTRSTTRRVPSTNTSSSRRFTAITRPSSMRPGMPSRARTSCRSLRRATAG
ncbi:MAG: hypothetical protein ACFWTZ_07980 [Burkholderia sp.]|jgi:hypothetical protein